jgi:hypothetical protein
MPPGGHARRAGPPTDHGARVTHTGAPLVGAHDAGGGTSGREEGTQGAGCAGQAPVECGERLREGDVPRVVGGDGCAQLPHPLGDRGVRQQLDQRFVNAGPASGGGRLRNGAALLDERGAASATSTVTGRSQSSRTPAPLSSRRRHVSPTPLRSSDTTTVSTRKLTVGSRGPSSSSRSACRRPAVAAWPIAGTDAPGALTAWRRPGACMLTSKGTLRGQGAP